jgi:shikimate O-hydroxycinnamoyltransferase
MQAVQPEAPAGVKMTMGGAAATELPQTDQKQFHLTPQQLKTLKAKVSRGFDEGQYVSTIDTVTALFSVLITQARGHPKDVKILTTVNGRTRFNPPLPPNYAGNCIFSASSSHSAQEMASVSVETIQRVALSLRTSLLRLDDEFLRDAIEFIAPKDGRWTESPAGTDRFFGTDIMFTSWANMGMYKADFGAGTPVYAGPPTLPVCDGLVFILEAMNHAIGLDVLLLLESSVMDKVTEIWNACELFRP